MRKSGGRFTSLFLRSCRDILIFFNAVWFVIRYKRHNRSADLFYFRKAIEIEQVSPFRKLVRNFRLNKIVQLRLPQFGNAILDFQLDDYFQMAICEEFVKYKIYDLRLVNFIPAHSIDCGAYRGYFTMLIAERFPLCEKICIEPHPENYKSLLSAVEKNNIKNISVYNKALSPNPEKLILERWGSNMARTEQKNLEWNVEVDTIDLFPFLHKIDSREPLVLKMDIEGGELDFFPACIPVLPATCAVFLETHDGWDSLSNIKDEFIANGFSFSILRDRGLYIDSFAIRNN